MDGNQAVSLVERVLHLKSLPPFAEAEPDHLAALARNLRERSFSPGQSLFRAGDFPEWLHLPTEGRVRFDTGPAVALREPEGWLDVLAQRPRSMSCVAETPVHALVLRSDELFDILEDFFDLSRTLLAHVARGVAQLERARGPAADEPGKAVEDTGVFNKIVLLKSLHLLSGASIHELAELAHQATEVELGRGEPLFRASDDADAFWVVLRGRVGASGPRTTVGTLDMLAQGLRSRDALATEPAHLLRVPAEAFFDLLEDHFDLVNWVFRDLAARSDRAHG